jgi:hypothetical protein
MSEFQRNERFSIMMVTIECINIQPLYTYEKYANTADSRDIFRTLDTSCSLLQTPQKSKSPGNSAPAESGYPTALPED